jgi:predicted acetyltransferase
MIETRIYPVDEFPPLLECQVRDFVRIVWPASNVDDRSVPLGPRDRDPVHVVIVDGDTLISHVQLLTFTIDHADESYRVMGVSGVLTYPNFRKHGYGRKVVEAATQYIGAQNVDFGMLFTMPELGKFYGQFGWVQMPNLDILAGDKDAPQLREEFTLMLPVNERGHQAVKTFENAAVYVGARLW